VVVAVTELELDNPVVEQLPDEVVDIELDGTVAVGGLLVACAGMLIC
jgi:hypothetical protein